MKFLCFPKDEKGLLRAEIERNQGVLSTFTRKYAPEERIARHLESLPSAILHITYMAPTPGKTGPERIGAKLKTPRETRMIFQVRTLGQIVGGRVAGHDQ